MLSATGSRQATTTSIALLLLTAAVWSVQAQNIDTKQPYIRSSPDQTNVDYFGYSIVLHQTIAGNPSSTMWVWHAPVAYGLIVQSSIIYIIIYIMIFSFFRCCWNLYRYVTHRACRLIVGAPNGTAPESPVRYTGLIYSCPLNSSMCSGLMGSTTGTDRRLFDIDREWPFMGDQFMRRTS